VHTLKGTGGNFGFEQITTICRQIETELHDNNTQAIPGYLDDLDAVYNRIQSGLQTA
jgi:HPt (histidine-containing phosphotransfer) domain-containing protein